MQGQLESECAERARILTVQENTCSSYRNLCEAAAKYMQAEIAATRHTTDSQGKNVF